ncbi:MAG TPA: PRC-barrel domain-containing protein [Methanocorpusculum sp.]|nr:PRC-barrel domain-containing protein [Methanocorpusculum sp.]
MKRQLSELYGMSVYSEKAAYLGKIADITLDVVNKRVNGLALKEVNQDIIDLKNFAGVIIPFRIVKVVGDIVIVRHIPGSFKTPSETPLFGA